MATKVGIAKVFEVWRRAGRVKPAAWSTGRGPEADDAEVEAIVETWAMLLGDVDDRELATAAVEIARGGGEWWPTPGQVLDVVRRHDEVPRLRGDDLWGRIASTFGGPGEWTARIRREFGPDAEAVIATIDAIGGWATVGGATASDIPHVRRRLAETWDAGRRREHEAAEHGSATRLLEERRALRLVRDDSPTLERPGITEWARGGGR